MDMIRKDNKGERRISVEEYLGAAPAPQRARRISEESPYTTRQLALVLMLLSLLAIAILVVAVKVTHASTRRVFYADPSGWCVTAVEPGYWVSDGFNVYADYSLARMNMPAFAYINETPGVGARAWVGFGLEMGGRVARWDPRRTTVEAVFYCEDDTLVATSVEWIFFTETPTRFGVMQGETQRGWLGGRRSGATLLPGVEELNGPIAVPNNNERLARTATGEVMVFVRFEFGDLAGARKRLLRCRVLDTL
jgi:hypothetical protein